MSGGALAVDARLFKEILENQISLQEKVKKLENLFISLQSETSLLKSISKSRNVSPEEEKSAELRSKTLGRKSHAEMLKELGIDGGDRVSKT